LPIAEKKWAAFQSDPDWIPRGQRPRTDGQIVGNIVKSIAGADVLLLSEVIGSRNPDIRGLNRVDPRGISGKKMPPVCGFARILVAKPVPTFAEYAPGADRHGPREVGRKYP